MNKKITELKNNAEKTKKQEKTKKFSKSSIVNSSKYINKRDALNTILKENVNYTLNEVDEILQKFYKMEVH